MTETCSNLDVEMALLGALISDREGASLPLVAGLLPDHFSEPVHARIYDAVVRLNAKGAFTGALGLKTYFEKDASLAEIGGTEYLARLTALADPPVTLKKHAALLRELHARREAIATAQALMEQAGAVDIATPFRATLAENIGRLQNLFDEGQDRKTAFVLDEAAAELVVRLDRIRRGETDGNAIPTGLAALDAQTGGLHRGEYVILGGRPSMGKTALAIQIAHNVAQAGGGVFYSSLEMPVALLMPRIAACRLWTPGAHNVHYASILRGKITPQQARFIDDVAREVRGWPFIIDEKEGLSPAELEARALVAKSRLAQQGKSLDLVVVDHLHKMRSPGAQSKVSEYTEISARLAEMAKRLDCPVLALAQLNRGVEARDDKRPQLSDLRESGSIEQDADTVLFVYRPGYYLERKRCGDPSAEADRMADLASVSGKLDVIIEKQRSGPIGTVDLWCDVACNVVRDAGDFEPERIAA